MTARSKKGAGHVHAAFTELEPEGIEDAMPVLNAEMLERPLRRAAFRQLWRIGEPYHSEPVHAVELRPDPRQGGGFPPFARAAAAWSDESLTIAVSRAVLAALQEAGMVSSAGALHVAQRAGGYVRAFLRDAPAEESRVFSEALEQALGPLDPDGTASGPRYVIPRYVEHRTDTWLSMLLPQIVGRYFQHRRRQFAMLHAVPTLLAKNKELAAIFTRHWNAHVSPGEAAYAYQGEGKDLLQAALRDGITPAHRTQRKEVFL